MTNNTINIGELSGMKMFKDWLKNRLRKALSLPPLEASVEELNQKINSGIYNLGSEVDKLRTLQQPFGIQFWYEANLWEPPVQIALCDLCKPGDVVFDVGANVGGLTTVMSRMTGPRGVVCAFEASPRIVDKCQRNIVLSGCSNVQLYNAAIYSRSHDKVPIYLGGHLNDSIYANNNTDVAAFNVPTLALDDFVSFTGLVPSLVKMDIEGAEFEAVTGMLNTISSAKPHLILETQPKDTRCLNLLRNKGYIAIDLNSYREIKDADDYPQGVAIRNNLYIHQDKVSEEPYYCPPFTFTETAVLKQDNFITTPNRLTNLKTPIKLDKGRYLIETDFIAEGINNEMMCGVKAGNNVIFRYHAYTSLLAQSYRYWVINLTETSEIQLFFEFMSNTYDNTFSINHVKVLRIADFDEQHSLLYV